MLPDTPDFRTRANPSDLPEWMDEPCSYEDFHACLLDLAKVNRVTLAQRPTLAWLARHTVTFPQTQTLHIVDVGCGGGDMLRSIDAWAEKRGLSVRLTGIDLNPYSIRAAQQAPQPESWTEWIEGDALTAQLDVEADIIISSLLTHHLPDADIVRFLAWMERTAQRGWFINDLYRSRDAYVGFGLLAKVAGWHRFVQHDGPVSIRRSFREADWQHLRAAAGLPASGVHITKHFPSRLCVSRWK